MLLYISFSTPLTQKKKKKKKGGTQQWNNTDEVCVYYFKKAWNMHGKKLIFSIITNKKRIKSGTIYLPIVWNTKSVKLLSHTWISKWMSAHMFACTVYMFFLSFIRVFFFSTVNLTLFITFCIAIYLFIALRVRVRMRVCCFLFRCFSHVA